MIDPGEVVVAVGHGPSMNEILCWHSGINFNVGLKKAGFAVLQNAHKLVAYVPPQIIT
jgi:phosphohistidine phosphatase SixA